MIITGVIITGVIITGVIITGAIITGVIITGVIITGVIITGVTIIITGSEDDWSLNRKDESVKSREDASDEGIITVDYDVVILPGGKSRDFEVKVTDRHLFAVPNKGKARYQATLFEDTTLATAAFAGVGRDEKSCPTSESFTFSVQDDDMIILRFTDVVFRLQDGYMDIRQHLNQKLQRGVTGARDVAAQRDHLGREGLSADGVHFLRNSRYLGARGLVCARMSCPVDHPGQQFFEPNPVPFTYPSAAADSCGILFEEILKLKDPTTIGDVLEKRAAEEEPDLPVEKEDEDEEGEDEEGEDEEGEDEEGEDEEEDEEDTQLQPVAVDELDRGVQSAEDDPASGSAPAPAAAAAAAAAPSFEGRKKSVSFDVQKTADLRDDISPRPRRRATAGGVAGAIDRVRRGAPPNVASWLPQAVAEVEPKRRSVVQHTPDVMGDLALGRLLQQQKQTPSKSSAKSTIKKPKIDSLETVIRMHATRAKSSHTALNPDDPEDRKLNEFFDNPPLVDNHHW
ncbi:putative transmembrane protein [Gregarina niphandrodes]|uniref:Transmembrane protein n=1 Tax=Gregarina niphandrodes TaxID=110365 RepID=A0A023BAN0_GRENI|nr:putative transmembrane protein [Gregarina niphandrodes]EZG78311.1 putative transmembrane protein [Gregarina niphandrodes]|eukprot:XP_011129349.1 putative transmembrane protein [Gregarina niphandrodes]